MCNYRLPDRIDSTGMKRMTARQPAQAHPNTLSDSVLLHGVAHVLRACRIKTARRGQHRRNDELVQPDDSYENPPPKDPLQRANRRDTSRTISGRGASEALRRGLITIDHLGFSPSRHDLTASRKRRLMRFRTTAFPMARGTVKPMRG